MAEETRELYAAVFGTDSDSDSGSEEEAQGGLIVDSDVEWEQEEDQKRGLVDTKHVGHVWEPVEGVEGLWRCGEFLDPVEQESLVKAIEGEGWFEEPAHNQAMRFGLLPGWAVTLSSMIFASISRFQGLGLGFGDGVLREEILARKPLFDQMIVNSYQPGEGIGAHVDLARFEDGIVVLSLLSSCVMRFGRCGRVDEKVDVLLSPGDLIVLSGDARYGWTHEINRERAEEQMWAGEVLEQARRISVTLRRLCPEENVHSMES
ncbi:hypothetical protein KC19_12G113800 [Ceratodon purpureus]|uniref:Fe2OG dioxygenase domain-containing protein n=1 Tax=Ceratodon purpureus TaxID=3225 RepID=A0A8T0GBU4_CERPU|nr:hypothetical protein KC19_12G113800 [Ceratodon purpureus]